MLGILSPRSFSAFREGIQCKCVAAEEKDKLQIFEICKIGCNKFSLACQDNLINLGALVSSEHPTLEFRQPLRLC
jgi:hypothetical protein